MTSTYDYSPLKVNNVTPTRVNAVQNGVTTQVLRLKANGTDYIHRTDAYRASITVKLRLNASNVKIENYSGCNASWGSSGNLIISLESVTVTGDASYNSVSWVNFTKGAIYAGSTSVDKIIDISAGNFTSFSPIVNYDCDGSGDGGAGEYLTFTPTISVGVGITSTPWTTAIISFTTPLVVNAGANIVVSASSTFNSTLQAY